MLIYNIIQATNMCIILVSTEITFHILKLTWLYDRFNFCCTSLDCIQYQLVPKSLNVLKKTQSHTGLSARSELVKLIVHDM